MRRWLPLLLLLLAIRPAGAEEHPPPVPLRDVAVTYRFLGPAAADASGMTLRWSAALGLVRTEAPGMGWSVVNLHDGVAFLVLDDQRVVMVIPAGAALGLPGYAPGSKLRRQGTGSVLGLACTVWRLREGPLASESCITAEGVLLRAMAADGSGLEAVEVTFGHQDAERFQRPEGYAGIPAAPLR